MAEFKRGQTERKGYLLMLIQLLENCEGRTNIFSKMKILKREREGKSISFSKLEKACCHSIRSEEEEDVRGNL